MARLIHSDRRNHVETTADDIQTPGLLASAVIPLTSSSSISLGAISGGLRCQFLNFQHRFANVQEARRRLDSGGFVLG
jgi:hypothetical protein